MAGFDIDPVEANVGQGQQNPLAGLGQIASTIGQIQQNRLFPLQQQTMQTELQTRQQALQAARFGALQSVLAQTTDDSEVPGALNRAVSMGLIDPNTAASAMGGNIPGLGLDAIHRFREQAISGAGNAAELAADRGVTSTVNTGGAINTINTKVAPGGLTTVANATGPAASIPTILSPTEEASAVPVVGQGGITTQHRLSEYVTPTGQPQPGVAPPITANPQATAAAQAVGSAATQMFNYTGGDGAQHQITGGALFNANGTMKPNVKDAAGNTITDGKGVLQVTLPPEQVALINSTASNEADRASALQTAFEGSKNRQALIEDLRATQGNFVSGPGAAKWAQIVGEANRLFPSLNLSTSQPGTAAASEEVFAKIAEQLANAPGATLGTPATNAGLAAREVANAAPEKIPEANMQVLAQAAGNEDLLQTKQAAWGWYQRHGGTSYNKFVQRFNGTHDPRAAWEPYMTPLQSQTMFGAMTPAQRAAYNAQKAATAGLNFAQ